MPQQAFTSCTALSEHFLVEAGRIGPEAYTRGREKEPIWLGLIDQKPWHDNMGLIVNNTIYQRSGLTVAPTWVNMALSDGASINGCLPPITVVSNSTTQQSYQRQWLSLESDPLCLQDIVVSNEPRRAIQAFVDNLMFNATYVRKERVRSEYERVCGHKVIIAPGLPEDSGNWPLVQPTSPVTMGVLRKFYRYLQRESDGTKPIAKNSRGAEQFIFVSSGETIENAVKGDQSIRDDFRWSTRVNELLGAFDQKFSYGGFVMFEESFPPRYNWTGSDFVRIPEYVGYATTIGNELEINPAWSGALYEVSYIFHPDVMISRVPNTKQSFGDVTYAAQNYSLDFRWLNEFDRNCNPDKTIGYFRAIGIHATEPVFTKFGFALMGLKCDVQLDLVPCAANSGYASSGVYSGPQSVNF